MKDIRKFLISLIIVIVSLIAVDFCIGKIGDKLLTNLPDFGGDIVKDNYRLNRMNEDVVLIGSSRCSHHYVTSIIKDSISSFTNDSTSVYNAGIGGKYANSNFCAIESIVNRYTPKLIILDISDVIYCYTKVSDIEFSSPHYTTNKVVKQYLDSLGLKEKICMQSSLYRYNIKLLRILANKLQRSDADNDGYEPLYNIMKTTSSKKDDEKEKNCAMSVPEYTEHNFQRMYKVCKEKGIKLILICSPRYNSSSENKIIAMECKKAGIPFYDYLGDDYFNAHPELFQDEVHLNNEGAHIFTKRMIEDLKTTLLKLQQNK